MKKFFTLMAAAVMALAANATDFTDNMAITVPSMGTTTQEATVVVDEVENSDGLYNITLKDVSFNKIELGDLKIENVKGDDDTDGFTWFEETTVELSIKLGFIPVTAKVTLNEGSVMKGGKLYLDLSINAVSMDITAIFGDNKFPKTYTDQMVVSLDGKPNPAQTASIDVTEQADGKYTLTLADFTASIMGSPINVGTIEITDLEATEEDGIKNLSYEGDITIKEGSEGTKWSMAGQTMPITLTAKMTDNKLYAVIDIDLTIMKVNVVFGDNDFTSGINSPTTAVENGTEAIYDLGGRKLNEMQKGINIVRKADGTTVKVLKK